MICPACGNETISGTFCTSCGAMLQSKPTDYRSVRYDTAELYGIFKGEYERYLPYKQVVDEIMVKQRAKEKHEKAATSMLPVFLFVILGIVLVEILFIIVTSGLVLAVLLSGSSSLTEDQSIGLFIGQVLAVVVGGGIALLCGRAFKKSQCRKAADDEAQIIRLQNSLVEFYAQAQAPLLPLGLSNPYHIYNLSEIVRHGRAHSVNEAIFVYMSDTNMDRRVLEAEDRANKARNAYLVMLGIYAYERLFRK